MSAQIRRAIYGGSFDPPHVGHVLTVTLAICSGAIDAVTVIPVADHAFGKSLTPLPTRLKLLKAGLAHLGDRVIIDPLEAELPTPNYIVNTVAELVRRHPEVEWRLILGADTWLDRRRWHGWERLEAMLAGGLMVFGREGVPTPPEAPILFTLPDISSTEIRRRRAEGLPFWWMVPEEVRGLIEAEGLYR